MGSVSPLIKELSGCLAHYQAPLLQRLRVVAYHCPCRCIGGSIQLLVTIPRLWGTECPLRISFFRFVHEAHVAQAAYFLGLWRGSTETTCERNKPAAKHCANQGITRITAAAPRCQGAGERAWCQALQNVLGKGRAVPLFALLWCWSCQLESSLGPRDERL